jgi:hypothetical protein
MEENILRDTDRNFYAAPTIAVSSSLAWDYMSELALSKLAVFCRPRRDREAG